MYKFSMLMYSFGATTAALLEYFLPAKSNIDISIVVLTYCIPTFIAFIIAKD